MDDESIDRVPRRPGPRTAEGKSRSALSAVRHGLAGVRLVLPGEDPARYEERMDGVFEALCPADDVQGQLATLVGDDVWKLERLAKIEAALVLARVEELLATTDARSRAEKTKNSLVALGGALQAWSTTTFPSERDRAFDRRIRALETAIDSVADLVDDLPADVLGRCSDAILRLYGSVDVTAEACSALTTAASELMAHLLEHGHRDEAAQEELRKAIATISLPNEADLKKLTRYRKMIEEGLLRRLAILEQLRRLAKEQKTAESECKSREFRMKLRIVR